MKSPLTLYTVFAAFVCPWDFPPFNLECRYICILKSLVAHVTLYFAMETNIIKFQMNNIPSLVESL